MSEHPVSITSLNDYIFCPASIYFHALDEGTEKLTYQSTYQINGSDETDSVYIFQMSEGCKVHKYGFTSHEDDGLLIC